MCGRFTLRSSPQAVAEEFGLLARSTPRSTSRRPQGDGVPLNMTEGLAKLTRPSFCVPARLTGAS
jgi:hypothetical protein